jgi:hypothetical protein
VVEVGRHVGASAPRDSAESRLLFQPGGNCEVVPGFEEFEVAVLIPTGDRYTRLAGGIRR